MFIKVTPQTKIPLASLDLRRGFRKFNPSLPPRPEYAGYLDRKQGLIITSCQGVVIQMTYIASHSDSRAYQSYYEWPEAFVRIATFIHFATIELRCPSRVKAGEAEPVYLWDIPADVPFSGRGRKITIDSSGLAGKNNYCHCNCRKDIYLVHNSDR